jgi:hypothetical protein
MDAADGLGLAQELGGASEPEARLRSFDDTFGGGICGDEAFAEDDNAGFAGEGFGGGSGVFSEGDVSGCGAGCGVDAAEAMVRAALRECAAEAFDEFAEFHSVSVLEHG